MTQREIKREFFRKKRLQQKKITVQKDNAHNIVNALLALVHPQTISLTKD